MICVSDQVLMEKKKMVKKKKKKMARALMTRPACRVTIMTMKSKARSLTLI